MSTKLTTGLTFRTLELTAAANLAICLRGVILVLACRAFVTVRRRRLIHIIIAIFSGLTLKTLALGFNCEFAIGALFTAMLARIFLVLTSGTVSALLDRQRLRLTWSRLFKL